jgi:competence protein ComEA
MRTSRIGIVVLVLAALLALAADVAADRPAAGVAKAPDGPVNINTAGVKQLMTLEGVGQAVAERIVEYRTAHGPFKKPEDVRKVQGLGARLFERNRERIVVK